MCLSIALEAIQFSVDRVEKKTEVDEGDTFSILAWNISSRGLDVAAPEPGSCAIRDGKCICLWKYPLWSSAHIWRKQQCYFNGVVPPNY